jgi:PIN domain nuclease of toxin-antitoxin system
MRSASFREGDSLRRTVGISDIVLGEIEVLHSRGRIRVGLEHPPLAASLRRVTIWPITTEICRQLPRLSDPADAIIAANSLAHDVPLVTRDARIRSSVLVRIVPPVTLMVDLDES